MNKSGMQPVGRRVLVKPVEVEEVSEGGIVLAKRHVEREEMAQVRGEVVAMGSDAFNELSDKLSIGDKCMIARYAGVLIDGDDGEKYRLCWDEDINGKLI